MHLLVTGTNGFIGTALVARLLRDWPGLERLTALDLKAPAFTDPRVVSMPGDITDPALLARAFAEPVDVVFHLASVPGGATERDPALGYRVNVAATAALLQHAAASNARFVFASSIATLGASLPDIVDDSTPLRPTMSYGAHKQIGEILLHDASRRGQVDGRGIRLPGIVMRPPAPAGLLSAFMSDLIRETAAGRRFVCPVSAGARLWLMSSQRIVDNLLHAAQMPDPGLQVRNWTLPALLVTVAELVDAVGRQTGQDAAALVEYQPDPALEQAFGAYPLLSTPASEALGFQHDGDAVALVASALQADQERLAHA
ncbi:NAD-dependent epimerase/dehydratase family protein [Pseudoxanthomonas sp.]|uniref:NAD-dependent epimerase/dehydratase family protein n=1 Tax=Pseudoxanthomonas sp. TaxID=1871049 RepID=UPI0026095596|nr:NAD-dependent epimerase/dehydratase family protein [Pseudoxanthomonas sp.]WDS35045.1 MAG: NAD-dependent epimerase/dehydratase family protein [Pseudoxanthomonas sp.]